MNVRLRTIMIGKMYRQVISPYQTGKVLQIAADKELIVSFGLSSTVYKLPASKVEVVQEENPR